jgi:hypothetical protein
MMRFAWVVLVVAVACRSSSQGVASQASPPPTATAEHDRAAATCPPRTLPEACPEKEPNVSRPCDAKALAGVECVYATGCCPNPTYVCDDSGHFAARFESCP